MNNERDEIIQVLLLNSTWDLIFVSKLIHDDYLLAGWNINEDLKLGKQVFEKLDGGERGEVAQRPCEQDFFKIPLLTSMFVTGKAATNSTALKCRNSS